MIEGIMAVKSKPPVSRKQRVDLSDADLDRLRWICEANAISERLLGVACGFSVARQAEALNRKNQRLADELDGEVKKGRQPKDASKRFEKMDVTDWGFNVTPQIEERIEDIMRFHGIRYISAAVRLAIRLQAAEDGCVR